MGYSCAWNDIKGFVCHSNLIQCSVPSWNDLARGEKVFLYHVLRKVGSYKITKLLRIVVSEFIIIFVNQCSTVWHQFWNDRIIIYPVTPKCGHLTLKLTLTSKWIIQNLFIRGSEIFWWFMYKKRSWMFSAEDGFKTAGQGKFVLSINLQKFKLYQEISLIFFVAHL